VTTFLAVYRLVLRSQATRARLLGLAALGAVGVIVGIAIGVSHPDDPSLAGAEFVSAFGLALLAPVSTLVLAAAALGDPTEDGTLVYLWLRPVPRLLLATAAVTASLTVTIPLVVVPLVIAAAATSGGGDLVVATALSSLVAVIGYAGLFVALGLRVRRALVWGLVYILIWEGFVASAGRTASRLALRAYTRSILSDITGIYFRLSDVPSAVAVIVPVGVAVLAVLYTARRLRRMDVA
jgi:ABC-2 type transport system permease protein